MASLANKLTEIVGAAFEACGLPPELGRVAVSDRQDLAQFQCNGAMAAAKQAKKNPREVAQAVIEVLQSRKEFSKIEIAGPGFINLNVTDEYLAAHLASVAGDARLGVDRTAKAETVILDYGGYNIAKPLHVGHLRSTIIGDAINKIMKTAGHKTISDVHFGDWGTQMGIVISELEIMHPEWPYFDEAFAKEYPKESPVTIADLDRIYPEASKACKENEVRLEKAKAATRALQGGHRGYRALWQHFVDVSVADVKKNLATLNVDFDLWDGEASANPSVKPIVDDLKAKKLAFESDGALVMAVAKNDDNKEMPPLILYKSDGAVMYGTTDLATIFDRMQKYKPAKIIYIVDQRQSLHFEQVFRAARISGAAPNDVELLHTGFGTMNGTDGKPFKTRAGGVMKLEDLISMGVEKARARLAEADLAQDMGAAEREDIAHKVAIAAIKFADLQNNRTADYVFDIDRMTSFEGKTGPYLLYQAVRIKSLLRKAAEQGFKPGKTFILQDADKTLALLLTELPDAFDGALRNYTPHLLCDYAYRLATAFSSFYAACHILSEADEALRASRLALCEITQRQLELVLGLLGIGVPERM
ncbi:MAG TPA: arginine--tRNA ligase [Rhodospirillaceae bacterium]|nr:arginine--tRNA ligase [Rhodospirillaceae bacterium]